MCRRSSGVSSAALREPPGKAAPGSWAPGSSVSMSSVSPGAWSVVSAPAAAEAAAAAAAPAVAPPPVTPGGTMWCAQSSMRRTSATMLPAACNIGSQEKLLDTHPSHLQATAIPPIMQTPPFGRETRERCRPWVLAACLHGRVCSGLLRAKSGGGGAGQRGAAAQQ